MENDDEEICTPPDVREAANLTTLNLLPKKSKSKYLLTYKHFMDWRIGKNIKSFSENVVLAYFSEQAEKYKSSSLWSKYSMLRSTLNIYNNTNIQNYPRLRTFLKRQSEGYQAIKSKIFSSNEIEEFLRTAPDEKYLVAKVVLIIGVMGACRTIEMYALKMIDITDMNKVMVITIPVTKTKIVRKFTITGEFYDVVKKYINLRPPNLADDTFFLNYQKGKCTRQRIGVNKLAKMGQQIASYLKLQEAEKYTGHSFRRSSATLLVDAGADITALKRHGGWKSTCVAEGYIDTSMKNKMDSANKILNAIQTSSSSNVNPNICLQNLTNNLNDNPTTSAQNVTNNTFNSDDANLKSPPSTIIYNYGTVNVYTNK